jgi:hypothetical protein
VNPLDWKEVKRIAFVFVTMPATMLFMLLRSLFPQEAAQLAPKGHDGASPV